MKLFYAPGACSLSPHIVLRELGLPFELVRVDGRTHKLADGADYYAVNPKGSVPALLLDDGQLLTEGVVIVQYLADQKPAAGLAPPPTSFERYRLQEWLNFIATDLHRQASPLFNPKLNDEARAIVRDRLYQRLGVVAQRLEASPFLLGERLTVADAYLFVILSWSKRLDLDLSRWPALLAFSARLRERPAVQEALAAEGLA